MSRPLHTVAYNEWRYIKSRTLHIKSGTLHIKQYMSWYTRYTQQIKKWCTRNTIDMVHKIVYHMHTVDGTLFLVCRCMFCECVHVVLWVYVWVYARGLASVYVWFCEGLCVVVLTTAKSWTGVAVGNCNLLSKLQTQYQMGVGRTAWWSSGPNLPCKLWKTKLTLDIMRSKPNLH